ncbi:MAG TPA: c-type cytochrome [Gemmatimonadales bacterium]|nr:c-type cytochrome [Gemmatimonadales bacterium]
MKFSWSILLLLAACRGTATPAASAGRVPADSEIPSGPLGASIRRGLALLTATHDSLPQNVGNDLRCVSCHLDEGRRSPQSWVGVTGRYPQYRARSGRVETLEYRINGCFERSLNGKAIAVDGNDMRDIVSYLTFLSTGVPVGYKAPPPDTRWKALKPDTAAGGRFFGTTCARCHGEDGGGTIAAPPLWGPRSFNIGAGMGRVRTAAAFIVANMPFDKAVTLTDQQALDVAAYVTSQSRPDFAGKASDWPNGDAPPDVAYLTKAAHKAPPASSAH